VTEADLKPIGKELDKKYANLPRWKRWWVNVKMAMPKWYQNWRGRRTFWQLAEAGALQEGAGKDSLIRMFACAELNRRNGDDSLLKILEKDMPQFRVQVPVKHQAPWE